MISANFRKKHVVQRVLEPFPPSKNKIKVEKNVIEKSHQNCLIKEYALKEWKRDWR